MKINWIVRLKNKNFWLTIIPAILLLVQLVLDLFGIKMEFGELQTKILGIVNAVFAILVIIGVVNDPTVASLGDSQRALGYEEPWKDDVD